MEKQEESPFRLRFLEQVKKYYPYFYVKIEKFFNKEILRNEKLLNEQARFLVQQLDNVYQNLFIRKKQVIHNYEIVTKMDFYGYHKSP